MKIIALFLVMVNFLTGSLSSIQTSLVDTLNDPQTYPLQSLTFRLISPEPVRSPLAKDPEIEAVSAIVMDIDTGKVLFKKNIDQKLAMASITKIMTALVVLKYIPNLNEVVTISEKAARLSGSQMYLLYGETMTVKNLLKGALINSANDAALALAEHTTKDINSFVNAMNQYAGRLGLMDTHFTNVYGADAQNHYSSAYNLARLTSHALQNDIFKSIVSVKETTVTDTTGRFVHKLHNTNKLIGEYINVIGVKTGTTEEAGASLVTAATGESGQTIVTVLLNSPERFNEGKLLLDWALKSYTWIELL